MDINFKARIERKSNMNILITGGAGFIGFHLAQLLLKKKQSIYYR